MGEILEWLKRLDVELLLAMNGSESLFWDGVMKVITSTWVWLPMFVVLFCILIRNNTLKSFFLTLAAIALTVTLCDQVASGICKPLFERFRPTQDPYVMYLIDIVDGYRGGRFGFISSHAANTFGVAVFLSCLFRSAPVSVLMYVWALLSSYSRIYLGVHYPGDILCGCLCGCLIGWLMFLLYRRLMRSVDSHRNQHWASGLYTSTGYLVDDVRLLTVTLLLTYALIPAIGIWLVGMR